MCRHIMGHFPSTAIVVTPPQLQNKKDRIVNWRQSRATTFQDTPEVCHRF